MAKRAASPEESPQQRVRQLIKAGKVKKKCCKSKPRCKKCPVRALEKARRDPSDQPATKPANKKGKRPKP